MKQPFTLLITLFAALCTFAQSISIQFLEDNTVKLNDTEITKDTPFSDIKSLLGEPVVYKEYPTGKTNYHYEELGISIHTVNGNVSFLGVNYNWDGDKSFPETSYSGTLVIDDTEFSKASTNAILEDIKNIEFSKIMTGFYVAKPASDSKQNFILLGFKEEGVTQVGFELH